MMNVRHGCVLLIVVAFFNFFFNKSVELATPFDGKQCLLVLFVRGNSIFFCKLI